MELAIDTETTGTDLKRGCKPFAVSMASEEGTNWWEWPVDEYTRQPMVPKKDILEIKETIKTASSVIFHNAKFDIRALATIGINWTKKLWSVTHDTILMAHVYKSTKPHGLKPLSLLYLDMSEEDQEELIEEVKLCRRRATTRGWNTASKVGWDYWLPKAIDPKSELLKTYGITDAIRTIGLYHFFTSALGTRKKGLDLYERERRLLPIVFQMEEVGVPIISSKLKKVLKSHQDVIDVSEFRINREARKYGIETVNLNSGLQMGGLLDKAGLNQYVEMTKGGKNSKPVRSVSESAILGLQLSLGKESVIVESFIKYTKANTMVKYLSGYNSHMEQDGRLYPNFNQIGTITTRFSSSDPNLQNVGKTSDVPLREVFGPVKGTLWYCPDYSQLELRILAVISNDQNMLEAFEQNEDIHQWTADLCSIDRDPAKAVNFAAVYGAGKKRLADMTGIPDMGDLFRKAYPAIAKFTQRTIRFAKIYGFVETMFGYRIYIEVPTSPDKHERFYAGVDYVIQGTAGDLLKLAMIECSNFIRKEKLEGEIRMIMTIHDELIFEVSKSVDSKDLRNRLRLVMEKPGELIGVTTPVTLPIVKSNWLNKVAG